MSKLNIQEELLPGDDGYLKEAIVTKDEFRQAFEAIEKAIFRSFGKDIKAATVILPTHMNPTQSTINERFKICAEWIRIARLDLGYSLQRCLDMVSRYLDHKLYGLPFDPQVKAKGGYFVSSKEANHG